MVIARHCPPRPAPPDPGERPALAAPSNEPAVNLASTRPPAVAGTFYPAAPKVLGDQVDRLLAEARAHRKAARSAPKALIVPHAGYVYSGPVAASAYVTLEPASAAIQRVVLVGPAHRAYVRGLASPGAARLATPLHTFEVDVDALAELADVDVNVVAHAREHSLEVQLPFLARVTPNARIVPLAVGDATPAEVAQVLERLWGGPETRIVISSDLSHYLPYALGHEVDGATAQRIVTLDARPLDGELACGAAGINGLLLVARRRGLRGEILDLRSSGDTAGGRGEVVGYGAFGFWEEA